MTPRCPGNIAIFLCQFCDSAVSRTLQSRNSPVFRTLRNRDSPVSQTLQSLFFYLQLCLGARWYEGWMSSLPYLLVTWCIVHGAPGRSIGWTSKTCSWLGIVVTGLCTIHPCCPSTSIYILCTIANQIFTSYRTIKSQEFLFTPKKFEEFSPH